MTTTRARSIASTSRSAPDGSAIAGGLDRASSDRRAERALLARAGRAGRGREPRRLEPLLTRLGSPQCAVPIVHIAGTNGKTTTAQMVDALLRGSGLRVGRFTSPHLQSLRERIVIDGEPLAPGRLAVLHDRVAAALDEQRDGPLSFFEVMTAIAFSAFAHDVDVVVLEAGIGGAQDATSVAEAEVAVLTPISLDHTELLGPDLATIAVEKAGIIRPGATAVLAAQPPAAHRVLTERAASVGARLVVVGEDLWLSRRAVAPTGQLVEMAWPDGRRVALDLPVLGVHQAANALAATAAAQALLNRHDRRLAASAIVDGLGTLIAPGRLELLRADPPLLVDVAHNPAGVAASAGALREAYPATPFTAVLAAPGDKDVAGMLRALATVADDVVVTRNASPRSLPVERLTAVAAEVLGADRVAAVPRLSDAINAALDRRRDDGGGVLVCGSVVTVGEARALLG